MLNILYFTEALFFIYISWLCGNLILTWLNISFLSKIKKIIYPVTLGYGLLGNLALASAIFGFHWEWFFYLLFLVIAILNKGKIYRHVKFLISKKLFTEIILSYKRYFKNYLLIYLVLAFWISVYLVINFLPWSFSDDGLFYHLPFVMEIIEKNPISFPLGGSMTYGHLPLFVEIFYSLPVLIFKNFIVARIIQFSAFILLLLALIDFSFKYLKNKKLIFLLATLILANMPFVRAGLEGGMIDVFTFLFGISSSLIIFEMTLGGGKNKGRLILSGILLGLALSTKYLALFFCLINLCFLLYFYLSQKIKKISILKNILSYSFLIILLSAFWYGKNLFYTNNPFFPIFTDAEGLNKDIGRFMIERETYNFFLFPFSFWGLDKITKLPYAALNALYFTIIYLAGIFLIIKKKITKLEVILFVYMQAFLLLLFYWSHQVRFAVPALLMADLLLVFLIDKITDSISNARKNKLIYPAICILSLVFLTISLNTFKNNFFCLQSINNENCQTSKSIDFIGYEKTDKLKQYLSAYTFPLIK